eukprot:scaffold1687_cov366-Pinguiococcus_pyrenoidosus.AAC.2
MEPAVVTRLDARPPKFESRCVSCRHVFVELRNARAVTLSSRQQSDEQMCSNHSAASAPSRRTEDRWIPSDSCILRLHSPMALQKPRTTESTRTRYSCCMLFALLSKVVPVLRWKMAASEDIESDLLSTLSASLEIPPSAAARAARASCSACGIDVLSLELKRPMPLQRSRVMLMASRNWAVRLAG